MKRDYKSFLKDIDENVKKIKKFTKNVEFDEFKNNEEKIYAVTKAFEIIGEASKNIPEEIREKYKDVEWKKIIRHRDFLSHYYWGVELNEEWKIVKDDLDKLEKQIKEIIKKEVKE